MTRELVIIRSEDKDNEIICEEKPVFSKKKNHKLKKKKIEEELNRILTLKLEEEKNKLHIYRNKVNQGLAELKIKKMNGQVLTATLSDMIKSKLENT